MALGDLKQPVLNILYRLDRKTWLDEFLPYYAKSRDYRREVLDDAKAVLEGLGLSPAEHKEWISRATQATTTVGRDGQGTLGEAHLSWWLETRGRVLLTAAGWKERPFEVTKGIDLVGILLPEMIVCHIEVKTWDSASDGRVRSAFKAMTDDQLLLTRLKPKLADDPNAGYYRTVAVELLKRIRSGQVSQVSFNPELAVFDRERLKEQLLRVGGVVGDYPGKAFPPNIPPPEDLEVWSPCRLVLLSIEGFKDRLTELVGMERELEKRSAAAMADEMLEELTRPQPR